MDRVKKIGLFGGSFNPPHWGHFNLAMELKEKKQLDEVWLIPAHLNPHKYLQTAVSSAHRFEMVKAAAEDFPDFFVNDVELRRPPPSYTVDTLKILISETKQAADLSFYLLLGEDAAAHFTTWHAPLEIIELATLLVGSREGKGSLAGIKDLKIRSALEKGWTVTHKMDISSRAIRLRLSAGLCCAHLVPASVLRYIRTHGLYTHHE